MLPTLSRLSVSIGPESRLRHRCSSQYLRISPLHWEFRFPLPYSSPAVSEAVHRLSRWISLPTDRTACASFTPSDSEQRSHPPYCRGCWHGVSRCFLQGYHQTYQVLPDTRFVPPGQGFTTRRPSSPTRHGCVRLSPIAEDSRLQPPVGVWAVSQSQCDRPPSQACYPSSPW